MRSCIPINICSDSIWSEQTYTIGHNTSAMNVTASPLTVRHLYQAIRNHMSHQLEFFSSLQAQNCNRNKSFSIDDPFLSPQANSFPHYFLNKCILTHGFMEENICFAAVLVVHTNFSIKQMMQWKTRMLVYRSTLIPKLYSNTFYIRLSWQHRVIQASQLCWPASSQQNQNPKPSGHKIKIFSQSRIKFLFLSSTKILLNEASCTLFIFILYTFQANL